MPVVALGCVPRHCFGPLQGPRGPVGRKLMFSTVIAKAAKQPKAIHRRAQGLWVDCFVAPLLAMTWRGSFSSGGVGQKPAWNARDEEEAPRIKPSALNPGNAPDRGRCGRFLEIEAGDFLHVLVVQLEAEDVEIFADTRRRHRLRDAPRCPAAGASAARPGPASCRAWRQSRRVSGRRRMRALPSGLHASVTMPCSAWAARSACCWRARGAARSGSPPA